ncbi:hypothetical protein CMV_007073 [Castanea mollissima]|uniref:DUF4283 domain-containing protein n=1 Tax=Castanea mollissima TaxID=60419 RepID=A0A8J4VSW6_9ROSI|nr:hypothetical protein CMV_007073 [Castanea mollissima]
MKCEFSECERYREEDAELQRSIKKVKDSVKAFAFEPPLPYKDKLVGEIPGAFAQAFNLDSVVKVSYKDSLLGDIPSAYAQAFRFERVDEPKVESDTKLGDIVEGMVDVKLSQETKSRIRAPWTKALIVKVYGKTMGYNYLTFKINTLWKPMAKMDRVDLGKDSFLIKFSEDSDYEKVLQGGPWFIEKHFLAIKPWEPYFKASKSTFSFVAVWIRFPELPIEFYDPLVLREIGSTIGADPEN